MTSTPNHPVGPGAPAATSTVLVVVSWLAVGLPLAWGVAMTIRKALLLFQ